jgi:hypothetical protein
MTAKEIITAALQEIGAVAAGADPSSTALTWALGKLNRLLKRISAKDSTLFYRVTESFTLVGGTASYAIGSSATFDTVRPIAIEQAFIRDSGNLDHHLTVRPISEYWGILEKATQDRPTRLFYDPTYPNGTIYLYYTPSAAETLYIVSQKPLTTYASELTSVSLPGEYEEMLITNLAVACSPAYGLPVSGDLQRAADDSYNTIIGRNIANSMKPAHLNIIGGNSAYNIDEG